MMFWGHLREVKTSCKCSIGMLLPLKGPVVEIGSKNVLKKSVIMFSLAYNQLKIVCSFPLE